MDPKEQHAILLNEIRYAQRITQRTARLYRRASTFLTFAAIMGGSGLATSMSASLPQWLVFAGGAVLACAAAAGLAVRPLEKAILNEQDYKKYCLLETTAVSLEVDALRTALGKARESDVAEVELLRDVAYNDVLRETGHPDMVAPLSVPQKLIATLA